MAEITAAAVKALRERTDMPMMKCKQALVEAGGDEDKAVDILKQEAGKILDKRKDNATSEGRIFIATTDDGSEAAMVEVCCESAPVGSGEHLEVALGVPAALGAVDDGGGLLLPGALPRRSGG